VAAPWIHLCFKQTGAQTMAPAKADQPNKVRLVDPTSTQITTPPLMMSTVEQAIPAVPTTTSAFRRRCAAT